MDMSQSDIHGGGASAENLGLDQAQLEALRAKARSEQNLPFAVLGGLVAALISAVCWAGVSFATGYQIGFMAIGVGLLVGHAVKRFGRGIDTIYGVTGAGLSLLGCVVGNVWAYSAMYAKELNLPFFQVLSGVDVNVAMQLLSAGFDPMDILFYAIAIIQGYRMSFLTLADIAIEAKEPKPLVVGGAGTE